MTDESGCESGDPSASGIVMVVLIGLLVLGFALVLSFYAVNPTGPVAEIADIKEEDTHEGERIVEYNESELPDDAEVVGLDELPTSQSVEVYEAIQDRHKHISDTTGLEEGMFVKDGESYYQIILEEDHKFDGILAMFAVIGWVLVFFYIGFLIMLDDANSKNNGDNGGS